MKIESEHENEINANVAAAGATVVFLTSDHLLLINVKCFLLRIVFSSSHSYYYFYR